MSNAKYLRPKAASEYLGLAVSTLAKMRLRGDGPPYTNRLHHLHYAGS